MSALANSQTVTRYYQQLLIDELYSRQLRNPAYSKRAFSQFLGLSPGALSEIMSGKRPLTAKTAKKLVDKLCLSPDESRHFYNSLPPSLQKSVSFQESDFSPLSDDNFSLIADWYHYALVNLSELSDMPNDPEYLAKRLNITPNQVSKAIERLERLQLIKIQNGFLHATNKSLTSTNDIPSAAIRRHHDQNLEKARYSLHNDSVEERDISSISMAIDPSRMEIAKREIKKFRRKVAKLLNGGNTSRIYTLSVQLFPIDYPEIKEN